MPRYFLWLRCRTVISQSVPCLRVPFDHDLFRNMVSSTESDSKEFSCLQPTQNPFLADSRQADHLCDAEIVRQDRPFFFQTQHIIICFFLPQFPLREVFTFSTALDRVCVKLSGRKFALPLRVGAGEVKVLSIVFRKIVSGKMKFCAGRSGEGDAKPRLGASEHIPAVLSRVPRQRHSSE